VKVGFLVLKFIPQEFVDTDMLLLFVVLTGESIETLRQHLRTSSSSFATTQKISTRRTGVWVCACIQTVYMLYFLYFPVYAGKFNTENTNTAIF